MSEMIDVTSLRAQLLPAIKRAIEMLGEEATGNGAIGDDFQLRACMQLARLAPFVLSSNPDKPDGPAMQELPPDLSLEESERLLAIIEADGREVQQ